MDLGLMVHNTTMLVPHPDQWLQQPLISKDNKVLQLVQKILYLQSDIIQRLNSCTDKTSACENLQTLGKYFQEGVVNQEIINFLDYDDELSSLIGRSTALLDIPITATSKSIIGSIETLQPYLVDDLTSDRTMLKLQITTQFTKLQLLMEAYTIPLCEALKAVEDRGVDQQAVMDVLDFERLMQSIWAAKTCLKIINDNDVTTASQELYETFGSGGPMLDLDKSEFLSTLGKNAWEPRNVTAALNNAKTLVKEFHDKIPALRSKIINVISDASTTTILCSSVFSISTIINVVIADLLTITRTQPKE
jgi:hypothetical protein